MLKKFLLLTLILPFAFFMASCDTEGENGSTGGNGNGNGDGNGGGSGTEVIEMPSFTSEERVYATHAFTLDIVLFFVDEEVTVSNIDDLFEDMSIEIEVVPYMTLSFEAVMLIIETYLYEEGIDVNIEELGFLTSFEGSEELGIVAIETGVFSSGYIDLVTIRENAIEQGGSGNFLEIAFFAMVDELPELDR